MSEQNKKPDERSNQETTNENDENAAVQRGRSAIAARKAADSEPDDISEANEEKDAEQWRNEG